MLIYLRSFFFLGTCPLSRNMWSVWQTVLEENEKLAKARLAAIEVFQQQIADEAKVLRDHKVHISKKCVNHLGNIQKEVQNSVGRIDITKKSYFDEEHSAHGVRDKARDIEEKLKKKKGSFFQSITSLQKNSARVTTRKEELEEKSTGARNDYLLSLAAANAHQNRYFAVDLQTTMTTMENYVFERIAEYLTLMGRTELLTCHATQNSFSKIRDQAQQLTREYNVQCCYLFYPVLKQHIQYEFEPCDNDNVAKITAEHDSAAATLSSEAKDLASRIVRENNSIRENSRKLMLCIQMRDAGQRSDPNDPNGPDLETKIDEFREYVRKSETEKARAEACLECLRAGGVNVDEWMQEAETLGVQELPRSNSSLSMRTDASGRADEQPSSDSFYDSDDHETAPSSAGATGGIAFETYAPSTAPAVVESSSARRQPDSDSEADNSSQDGEAGVDAVVEQERQKIEQLTVGWDDPTAVDWGAEESANGTSSAAPDGPAAAEPIFKCTALYSYTAQNPDELSIVENEQLEVVGEGDGDGWLRARNYRGEEGYVPHNYLDVERDVDISGQSGAGDAAAGGSAADKNRRNMPLNSQISFSSVDYTVDSEDTDMYADSVQQSPDQVSVISAPLKEVTVAAVTAASAAAAATAAEAAHDAAAAQRRQSPPVQEWCIALYDYDASAEDELTFEENQLIKIVNKSPHGVDDGWWEGELNGVIGNFPSLVVEECDGNGDPLSASEAETPSPTGPPAWLPPFAPAAPASAATAPDSLAGLAEAVGKAEQAERERDAAEAAGNVAGKNVHIFAASSKKN